MRNWEIVLRGGRVIDPESGLDAIADVAIAGDRVAAVIPHPADINGVTADTAGGPAEDATSIDVSGLAASVRCPTLVIHARRDQRVPVQQARELAAQIPGSTLRLVDSGNRILAAREPAWRTVIQEINRFLA